MRVVFTLLLLTQLVLGAYDWTNVENAIQNAINDRIFTGCVLGIATNNATLFKKAYGTIGPKYGFYSPPVTVDMKFDLGLLTEPVGINLALMYAWDQKKIDTVSRVGLTFFDFNNNGKGYVTFQNLLEHNSGISTTI